MVMADIVTSTEVNSVIVSVNKHGKRVGDLCCNLYKYLGMNERDCSTALLAGKLHDVGKFRIPISVLDKPGELTTEERALIENHSIYSAEILKSYKFNNEIIESALYHHENEDGSGYPLGLKGKEIPLLAKVVHICDVFDALLEKRSYKKSLTFSECVTIMDGMCATGKFNKKIYNAFKLMLGEESYVPNYYIDDSYYSFIRSRVNLL